VTEATEGDFPHAPTEEPSIRVKQASLWFRIDGLLDRLLTAVRHLASMLVRMENRVHHGPAPDYPPNQAPWVYYGDREPTPREPSWQNRALSIVGTLLVAGILAIFGVLWSMNSTLSDLKGDGKMVAQRLDAQDKHLEATDREVEEIKREIWPHKH
jgi:hypothetical protein